MNFFEIEAFLRTAESSSIDAAILLGRNPLDICLAIENLQNDLCVELFSDITDPSKYNLTEYGSIYTSYAKAALYNMQTGMLSVLRSQAYDEDKTFLKVSLCPIIGKQNITDCLQLLLNQKKDCSSICFDIVTPNAEYDDCSLKFHVVLGKISPNYKDFFTTRWTAVITQGLYASEQYIRDVGFPEQPEDLLRHTMIVCGESFNDIKDSKYNWHLSEKCGLPQFTPSIVVSNPSSLLSAINADLGIGSSFDHQRGNLKKIFPDIVPPAITLDFSIRREKFDALNEHIDNLDNILQKKLRSLGIEIIMRSE